MTVSESQTKERPHTVCVCVCVCLQVCIETYLSSCHQRSINTAVRATLSQILGDLTLQLRHRQEVTQYTHTCTCHTQKTHLETHLMQRRTRTRKYTHQFGVDTKTLTDLLLCVILRVQTETRGRPCRCRGKVRAGGDAT